MARFGFHAIVGMACLLAAACASRGAPEDATMEYLETWRGLRAQGVPFPAGSDSERQALESFGRLFEDLKAPDLDERVRAVYAEDAWFNDTLKTVEGVDGLARYLGHTADALESGRAEILDVASSNGDYYVRWEMTLRFAKIARGETHRSVGVSHLRFDEEGKVVLHQDFWDSTSGLFEHVPGLGWLLRQAKSRI